MCTTCGCGAPQEHAHDHGEHAHAHDAHDDHAHHRHAHGAPGEAESGAHGHTHANAHDAPDMRAIETRILARNDMCAAENRAWFGGREILAVNLLGSPGSGKTTLLERTIDALGGEPPLFVIEGDQATEKDGDRIRKAGAPAAQVNTGQGCHLDAEMVKRSLRELKPAPGSVVFIENVGNLVCPALFDLGERAKAVVFSITEGEDKPLKYPHMFRAARLVALNKMDLLPHLDFSLDEAVDNLRKVNPDAVILTLSTRTGEGLEAWRDFLLAELHAVRRSAFL